MLKHVIFSKCLLRVAAVCCLSVSTAFAFDVTVSLAKADKLLAAGDCVEALEIYSKCAGAAPDNAAAITGMKQAKNQIRQQMGDVSAARLTKMLAKLDAIDADRAKDLSRSVAKAEKARNANATQVVILEGKLEDIRTNAAHTESELEQVQKELGTARRAETDAQKMLAKLNRDLQRIKLDRQADQETAESRIEQLMAENKKNADEASRLTAALNAAQSQTQATTGASTENTNLKAQIAAVTAENASLKTEKDNLLKQLNVPVPQNQELAAVKAQNAELQEKNQTLSAALKMAEAQTASPKIDAPELAKMKVDLETAKMENDRLNREVDRLRQEAASAQVVTLAPPVSVPETKTAGEAEKALKDLRTGLNTLESGLPQPVEIPEVKAPPVTQTRKFKKSLKKLTRQTENFSGDVSELEALTGALNQEFTEMPDSIDSRLRNMDALQARADINLAALKKRLHETEALNAGSAE